MQDDTLTTVETPVEDDTSPVDAPSAVDSDTPPTVEVLFERAREAVMALRAHGIRSPDGRAVSMLNLRHGLRSTQLIEQPDIAAWHREQIIAIEIDLGGESELTTLQRAAIREAARLEVILAALGTELLEGGVLTGKGKMRACTTTYLMVLDRFNKLAATLGFQRVAKPVHPLDAVRAAVEAVNQ